MARLSLALLLVALAALWGHAAAQDEPAAEAATYYKPTHYKVPRRYGRGYTPAASPSPSPSPRPGPGPYKPPKDGLTPEQLKYCRSKQGLTNLARRVYGLNQQPMASAVASAAYLWMYAYPVLSAPAADQTTQTAAYLLGNAGAADLGKADTENAYVALAGVLKAQPPSDEDADAVAEAARAVGLVPRRGFNQPRFSPRQKGVFDRGLDLAYKCMQGYNSNGGVPGGPSGKTSSSDALEQSAAALQQGLDA